MKRMYQTNKGFITIPEATRIMVKMLKVQSEKEAQAHYQELLDKAKLGMFGAKRFGTRMYQVKRDAIIEYAEECALEERINLFNIHLVENIQDIAQSKEMIMDAKVADHLISSLQSLLIYKVIDEEAYTKMEQDIVQKWRASKAALAFSEKEDAL
ncbi:hypothetical protein [Metabacillus iocasae]|uniref:Uncharacterized protein n=1 Tax=Priestia iocasae TaxID=2291674 RepID=A0ABS2QX88_9BACI|nr:hypothetical protein [Metabacillus iocasae]MBM7703572.1 hypothetical protein [Metabacillus iocasae]